MAALCCIYTGWLDVIRPEKGIAHTAVCVSAPHHSSLSWFSSDTHSGVYLSSAARYSPPLGCKSFNGGVSWSGIRTSTWNGDTKKKKEKKRKRIQYVANGSVCVSVKVRRVRLEGISDIFSNRLSSQYWTPRWLSERATVAVQALVHSQAFSVVSLSSLVLPFWLWPTRIIRVLFIAHRSWRLGSIPLQVRLPEKLLWWNVRQEKGRWGQTEKLFSLSLCFTLLTSVQNPHLAVIASMREEVEENECEKGARLCIYLCAWLRV